MKKFSHLSVGTKLSALLTIAVSAALVLLATLIYRQSAASHDAQVLKEIESATTLMHQSVAMYDRVLSEETDRMGQMFAGMLPAGEPQLDTAKTVQIGDAQTPTLRLGQHVLNLDFASVDHFATASGASGRRPRRSARPARMLARSRPKSTTGSAGTSRNTAVAVTTYATLAIPSARAHPPRDPNT